VEVQLRDDEPRFEIVPDRAYDFIDPDRALPNAGVDGVGVPLIYHGSLALRNARSAAAARAVIQVGHQAGSGVFFDVNLRPPWWRREQVEEWMRVADHIKLNEAELASLLPEIDDLEARASGLLSRTGAAAVYVTMGAEGARAFTREGATHSIRPTRSPKLADTVGAGDAFSSVLILGLLREWPLESSLHRAQEFAEAVVELHGATTIDPGFYSRYQKIWGIS
jgi:fructokinase